MMGDLARADEERLKQALGDRGFGSWEQAQPRPWGLVHSWR